MADILDEDWRKLRGVEIQSVGIASISYDDESAKLINLRNRGAMMSDPSIREGYVQTAVANGIEAAGSNSAGSMTGFMGVGAGMNAGSSFMSAASAANTAQMKAKQSEADGWKCACGSINTGNFCQNCGEKKPETKNSWKCSCGTVNTGNFCSSCGTKKPDNSVWTCSCGSVNTGNFCSECGTKKPDDLKCPKCGYSGKGIKFCPECGSKME